MATPERFLETVTGFPMALVDAINSVFGGSGANASVGLVPDPGSSAGTTKFLREDGSWQIPVSSGGGAGPVIGFELTSTGTDTTISIATGVTTGQSYPVAGDFIPIISDVAFTKTTAAFSAGTGNGALDTGVIAVSTWYHLYAILNSNTGDIDFLLSLTGGGAITIPSGFDFARRIGSVLTTAAGNITGIYQVDNWVHWKTVAAGFSDARSASPAAADLDVPPDFNTQARVILTNNGTTAGDVVWVYPTFVNAQAGTSTLSQLDLVNALSMTTQFDVWADDNQQVMVDGNNTNGTFSLRTIAYMDPRPQYP